MKTSRKDPAERSGFLRLFYRDWRPTRFGRIWNGTYAWISGLGLTSQIYRTLQVKNRNTGRLGSTVLVVASHKGQRYIVSMLGNGSEWVQNVRAASGEAFIKRGRSRPVMLTEVPPPRASADSQGLVPNGDEWPATLASLARRTTLRVRSNRSGLSCFPHRLSRVAGENALSNL
jgi:hypothetical protein